MTSAVVKGGIRFLVKLLLSILALSAVIFFLTAVIPGDPARAVLGRGADPEQIQAFHERHELDEPIIARYGDWLGSALRGDLGVSYSSNAPVTDAIRPRLTRTLTLTFAGFILAGLVGVPLGLISGWRAGGKTDTAGSFLTLALSALPEFAIGLILIYAFAVRLRVLPVDSTAAGFESPLQAWRAYVLPTVAVALTMIPYITRLTRANARRVVSQPFVRAATLRGIRPPALIFRHVMPTALPPTVNVLALLLAYSVGGLVVIEAVFGFPGLGLLLVQVVGLRDMPMVQALALLIGTFFIVTNQIADWMVHLLTPKLRMATS